MPFKDSQYESRGTFKGSAKHPPTDEDYMTLVRNRFSAAMSYWSVIRQDFRDDIRFVSGDPSDQWDSEIKDFRDNDGIPALTMDRLNPLINQIVNEARKDRPQPKVNAGDGGDPATADVIEGKMRHVLYESHADIAFDCAEMYCASGGIGYYRITKEWIGKRGFIAEPRVKRVPDPLSVLEDPAAQEVDFSDGKFKFIKKKYDRKEFKREFKVDPIDFPFESDPKGDWGDGDTVTVAEYWWIEEIPHRYIALADGREDISTEIGDFDEADIVNERKLIEKIVHCDIVDGARKLESTPYECQHIPIIPVIGKEVISEGQRRFVSAVRYSRDPQMFINVSYSSTAEKMSTANLAPFIGPKGAFKDAKWSDGKRHFYLEYEIQIAGLPAGESARPERNAFEPAIQATTSATAQGIDALKGAVGYVDSVTSPSQNDLSGVAVQRRDAQANLANIQYESSLTDSMWHCGRVLVDCLLTWADTPRMWQTRKEDGTQASVPITMDVPDGQSPMVAGQEQIPHMKIDGGDYGVTISVGPSFNTKTEEGTQFLLDLVKADPALIPIYAPAIFKRLGYEDLEEIATAAQPPQIQQALAAARGQGPNPAQLQQQAQQLQAQNQQLQQTLQEVLQIIKTKQIENQGRLQVEQVKQQGSIEKSKLDLIADLIKQSGEHAHDAAKTTLTHHVGAIKHMVDTMHSTELASNPPMPAIDPNKVPKETTQ